MITDDELAAVVIALQSLNPAVDSTAPQSPSRWKLAARHPDLELEDVRAL